jgi:hypothetical protein
MMKKSVFVSLLCVAAAFVGRPSHSSALEIHGVGSGRCVDIRFPANFNGAGAQIWDCHGLFNQVWNYEAGSFIGPSFMCLAVAGNGTVNGTRVQLATCNGTNAQKFRINQFSQIVHVGSGKCLDTDFGATENGRFMQIWQCHGGISQKWRLQK